MAFDNSKEKIIEKLFSEETRDLPEDKDLRSSAILNNFRSEHGRIMNEHADEYTYLLKAYIENSQNSSKQKKWFKSVFFVVTILILIASFVSFSFISISMVNKKMDGVGITAFSGILSSLAGLLSLYIAIPKIIAKYLFNQKEDKNMAKIVESIQNYDEKVFKSMNTYSFGETIEKEGGIDAMSALKEQAEVEGIS